MISEGREGKKRALIISVTNYNRLQPLDFCKNDGEEMYELLKSLGYEITDTNKLIGEITWQTMREAIYKFFGDKTTRAKDTLLFYFSGHGVPDGFGDNYLATSEIDPDEPHFRGFSFGEITKLMNMSTSTRIVTMLDCCYSGAARIGRIDKSSEGAAAKLAREAIDDKSKILEEGEGKCLLAASMPTQQAYGLKEKGHSIFTYYLLEGLKGGNGESVDKEGRVTPDTLGSYVYEKVTDLAPQQKPIKKVEEAGNIILAYYPDITSKNEALKQLLRKGNIQAFNEMRQQNPGLTIDLSDENLRRTHLSNVNLSNVNLHGANLTEADLEGADLRNAILDKAKLEGANFHTANLSNASLELANLTGANLAKANLADTNLLRADLSNANLYAANLNRASLVMAKVNGTNFTNAKLDAADFRGTNIEVRPSPEPITPPSPEPITPPSPEPITPPSPEPITPPSPEPITPPSPEPITPPGAKAEKPPSPRSRPKPVPIKTILIVAIAIGAVIAGTAIYFLEFDNKLPVNGDKNHGPIAIDQSVSTYRNEPVLIKLKAKDQDPKDDLTAIITASPRHGKLSSIDQTDGSVTYTPDLSFNESDKFTFKVNDGKENSNIGTVGILVKPNPNDNSPPKAIDKSVATTVNTRTNIALTASDKDNDELTATIVKRPLHGTLNDINQNTGVVTYSPKTNFTGNDSFQFKVNDGKIDSNLGKISLTVKP
jgi:hypothetical protein